ncbi:uncharacterized protein BXZ73DRAFT_95664 [Epithele typhae]|uniref:uncharacterized protein n=1 Tax=Epithele typhae TaxID=378194 RepID=UPI0020078130|nr:uncharacterized protein BXZ73DRAFT_95664 [Epithele typhae]KAH9946165.1 hypothetical protein BXZ73DRAFT_95664 [Epithele typhae]
MPKDIVAEVFSHLSPKDLLALARTSKLLRSLLMSKQNVWYWIAARANVPGMPPCPPYLSEPKYANFVFSNLCSLCPEVAADRRSTTFPDEGLRLCCRGVCLNGIAYENNPEVVCLAAEVEKAVNQKLPVIMDRGGGTRFPIPTVALKRFQGLWEALKDDPEGRKQLVVEETALHLMKLKFRAQFREWKDDFDLTRAAANRAVREQRVEDIKIRMLNEPECTIVINKLDRDILWYFWDMVEKQAFARRTAPLTDRGWNSIRQSVIQWTQDASIDITLDEIGPRLYLGFEVVLAFIDAMVSQNWAKPIAWIDGWRALPSTVIAPWEYLTMGEVRALVELGTEVITIERLRESLCARLPALITAHLRSRQAEFENLLEDTLGPFTNTTQEPLALALALFDCTMWHDGCGRRFMRFPDVLDHHCEHQLVDPETLDEREYYYRAIYQAGHEEVRVATHNVAVTELVVSGKAQAVVHACGLDPRTATLEDMERVANVRLTCGDCAREDLSSPRCYQAFGWRGALCHQESDKHRSNPQPCQWVVLPHELWSAILAFEEQCAALRGVFYRCFRGYRCPFCDPGASLALFQQLHMVAHLTEE